MGIHGVDADDQLRKSTQAELYALLLEADRVLCY
jgi:hypothetical protein